MSGLAKLGYAYAEQAMSRDVDGSEHAIAVGDIQVSAYYHRKGDALDITITKDGDNIEIGGRTARDVVEVMRGIIACDLGAEIDPLAEMIASRAEMIEIIRILRTNDGECLGDHPEWLTRIDTILAKFPVKP